METILNVMLVLAILALPVLMYLFVRNNWVYKVRVAEATNDMKEYSKLPSYDEMIYRYFYIWDVEKMKGFKNE